MIRQFIPIATEAVNACIFTCLILGIVAVLFAAYLITDALASRYNAQWWQRAQSPRESADRRQLNAIVARREGQN